MLADVFTRRKTLTLIACCLLAVGAVVFTMRRPADGEPRYQGRQLSDWVVEYEREWEAEKYPPYPRGKTWNAELAITGIGTNAIPYLLEWIQYKVPRQNNTEWLRSKRRQWLHGDLTFRNRELDRAGGAKRALIRLGDQTELAVGPLQILFIDPQPSAAAYRAGETLGCLGPIGIPSYMAALTNDSPVIRKRAASLARHFGTNAVPLMPLLIGALTDQDKDVADSAAHSLTQLKMQCSDVVAALIAIVETCDIDRSAMAMLTLRNFGTNARPAVPTLVALNNTNTNYKLRRVVRFVLEDLAPELLTNAVPQ